ncbi:MAG: hypothetical protein M3421_10580, partial [Bacteroidota bacterium]|nr:hypothetical protein [Bacteroidota bacterium]
MKKIFAFFNIPILFFLVWVLFLSFTTTLSYGQQQVDDTSPDLNLDFDRNCATMEQDSILRMKYPALGSLDEFEIALQGRIRELEKNAALARTTDVIISIPLIVHIVHNGEAVGQGTNISAAQVQAQLEV